METFLLLVHKKVIIKCRSLRMAYYFLYYVLKIPLFFACGKMEKKIRDFSVKEDDIWISSFPKCGTTWTQVILQ